MKMITNVKLDKGWDQNCYIKQNLKYSKEKTQIFWYKYLVKDRISRSENMRTTKH